MTAASLREPNVFRKVLVGGVGAGVGGVGASVGADVGAVDGAV